MEEGTFLKAASPSSRSRSPESLSGEGHNPTDLDVLDWGPWTWNKDLECAERIAIKLDGMIYTRAKTLASSKVILTFSTQGLLSMITGKIYHKERRKIPKKGLKST
jgi:hypothetical protein